MSIWEFLLNNPEWVTVFTSVLFAIVTACIIWRQKCIMEQQVEVMRRQGENSAHHERMQNRMFQLQHEHEWLSALNVKREAILKTATELHIKALYLESEPTINDRTVWGEFQAHRAELRLQMEILDVAAYTKDKDGWYEKLAAWSTEIFRVITENFKTESPELPTTATRRALEAAETTYKPVAAIYALQLIIKHDTEAFKKKWDAETVNI